jgi:hypothetical protein
MLLETVINADINYSIKPGSVNSKTALYEQRGLSQPACAIAGQNQKSQRIALLLWLPPPEFFVIKRSKAWILR